MGVPSTRTPVRVARGTYANLTTTNAIAALEEGEIAYATDTNTAYVVETESGTKALRQITGQAANDILSDLAGLTQAADKLPYFTSSTAAGTTTLTAFARTILDDADAAAVRTTIGAGTSNVSLSADNTWTGAQIGAIDSLASGSTITIDMSTGNNHSVTLGHATRFNNPTGQTAGQSGSIIIIQDGTGSRTAEWGTSGQTSAWKWKGGNAPTLTTTAAAVDRVDYIIASANNIHAVATLDIK